ncbi:MAG: Gfo/Idh/MocA family oxidoreductase [Planctomycetes bacterium]|nr:Gfo/Idh/MocA family oxidoreductase [Planctomycetota bacterium]MCH9723684.1 Gfo/Idh/MocA family oxidoreductase [Planctomycetota bacterium]MCH9778502.1 Gfo/Idh/MocA family oxidoreductase [Planctomycetota bacterium]MCH9791535.1 Gfo/Idh/MocA family oxidoreductase [Planctomycetota bacterium]
MKDLKVGIIGAGGIAAKMHLPELQTVDDCEVVMLAGRKQSRLDVLCRKFNVPHSTQNYQEVIDDDRINAVAIALPHPLHVEWGVKAIKAGKHVYMQKPLSTSMDEADAFVEETDDHNQTVLALPYMSNPHVLATRDYIQEGKLGTISSAQARSSHGGPEVYYAGIQEILEEKPTDDLWFFDADKADVGALFDMGVYAIANLVGVVGAVKSVTAKLTTVSKPTRLEDTASMILEFENGALGTAQTGWCDAARTYEFSVHGTAGKIVSSRQAESLQYLYPLSDVDEDLPLGEETVNLSDYPIQNSHQHWAACIRQGVQPPLSNAATARHVTEILLASLKSSRENRTVDITSRLSNS